MKYRIDNLQVLYYACYMPLQISARIAPQLAVSSEGSPTGSSNTDRVQNTSQQQLSTVSKEHRNQ
jgi:hypothetical protein